MDFRIFFRITFLLRFTIVVFMMKMKKSDVFFRFEYFNLSCEAAGKLLRKQNKWCIGPERINVYLRLHFFPKMWCLIYSSIASNEAFKLLFLFLTVMHWQLWPDQTSNIFLCFFHAALGACQLPVQIRGQGWLLWPGLRTGRGSLRIQHGRRIPGPPPGWTETDRHLQGSGWRVRLHCRREVWGLC